MAPKLNTLREAALMPQAAPPPAAPGDPTEQRSLLRHLLESQAIGKPGEGKRLYLVGLPGHKSRVTDKERGVPLHLDELPVWAETSGDARTVFDRYNGICSTKNEYRIEEAPAA